MNRSKLWKKRGRYKKFLHPGAKFEVPKSTVSRHRLANAAVSSVAENQTGTSWGDGETTSSTAIPLQTDALPLNENITQPDEDLAGDSSEASHDSLNAQEPDEDAPSDSSEASHDSLNAQEPDEDAPSDSSEASHDSLNAQEPDEDAPSDSSEASHDSLNAQEPDEDAPSDSSEASHDSLNAQEPDEDAPSDSSEASHDSLNAQEPDEDAPSDSSEASHESLGEEQPGRRPHMSQPNDNFTDLFREIVTEKVVVSRGDILLMVMKYALKTNLSLTALSNLTKTINLMFERPILPHSQYMFGKLCSTVGTKMTFHFFCPKCYVHAGHSQTNTSLQCPKCGHVMEVSAMADAPFFVLLDIPSQVQKLVKNCDLLDLTKPLRCRNTLSDITDGQLYRDFVTSTVGFGNRISFVLNTDGAPLFKSSGTAIWPVQLLINEIPPEQRMNKLVLAALWFGKEKPDMGLFQGPFVDALNKLGEYGFLLEHEGKEKVFKAFCICCAVDTVARAPMQGVMQFNGYYGCNWCLQRGDRVAGATKYPVQQNEPIERTEEQMLHDMETAVKDGAPVHGVKTVSPLINLQQFNIVSGFVPDYMHCVLLGLGRQFLELWLEGTGREFYIGRHLRIIDERLLSLTPPREVKRMPRSLKERKWWKAKELENWILFYSLPVLEGILERKYLQHWACLVESLHLLLEEHLFTCDLAIAEKYLLEFHIKTEVLYGKESMTYNMHQVTHLAKSVHQWGPLWSHSAFPFESGNGSLKSTVKATNGIPHQICRSLQMQSAVYELTKLSEAPQILAYCSSFDKTVTQKAVSVCGNINFFGRGALYSRSDTSVQNHDKLSDHVQQFSRVLKKKTVLTNRKYAETKGLIALVFSLQVVHMLSLNIYYVTTTLKHML
ncbi:uncharacterized protein LOC119376472 [Rhipicephalus sanguineus]|uniref:uncharacterized protein LOC119376472 n=1 Tax=Rhipicephalus sanguineus TaxID=34632 RepID=UPI001893D2DD|nr:uncharacterized protein LOC119376472 [Rhipicephalus sanguineus]